MSEDVTFSCGCGQIHGVLRDVSPKTGTALVCYCSRCRAAEVFLDQADPQDDGVPLFQTTCDRVVFTAGANQMYAFSFEKRGLIHWYAKCCKVPLFNTTATPTSGFVSVLVNRVSPKEPLGPIKAFLFQDNEGGKQVHKGLYHVIAGATVRAIRMRISGKWKNNPFFGKTRAPISRVHVLSDVEKRHLPVQMPD